MPIINGVEYWTIRELCCSRKHPAIQLPEPDFKICQGAGGVWAITTNNHAADAWRADRADIASVHAEGLRIAAAKDAAWKTQVDDCRRKELKAIFGQRLRFSGTFERFGTKSAYRGPRLITVLLKDIKNSDGKVVTDHLWFNLTVEFDCADLKNGDVVSFDARVDDYVKGLEGYGFDYKLSRPTKVVNHGAGYRSSNSQAGS